MMCTFPVWVGCEAASLVLHASPGPMGLRQLIFIRTSHTCRRETHLPSSFASARCRFFDMGVWIMGGGLQKTMQNACARSDQSICKLGPALHLHVRAPKWGLVDCFWRASFEFSTQSSPHS